VLLPPAFACAGKACFDVLLQLPPAVLDACLARLDRRRWGELESHSHSPECRVQLVAGQAEVLQKYKAKAVEVLRAETAAVAAAVEAKVGGWGLGGGWEEAGLLSLAGSRLPGVVAGDGCPGGRGWVVRAVGAAGAGVLGAAWFVQACKAWRRQAWWLWWVQDAGRSAGSAVRPACRMLSCCRPCRRLQVRQRSQELQRLQELQARQQAQQAPATAATPGAAAATQQAGAAGTPAAAPAAPAAPASFMEEGDFIIDDL
jgi:hypothetical protein